MSKTDVELLSMQIIDRLFWSVQILIIDLKKYNHVAKAHKVNEPTEEVSAYKQYIKSLIT